MFSSQSLWRSSESFLCTLKSTLPGSDARSDWHDSPSQLLRLCPSPPAAPGSSSRHPRGRFPIAAGDWPRSLSRKRGERFQCDPVGSFIQRDQSPDEDEMLSQQGDQIGGKRPAAFRKALLLPGKIKS